MIGAFLSFLSLAKDKRFSMRSLNVLFKVNIYWNFYILYQQNKLFLMIHFFVYQITIILTLWYIYVCNNFFKFRFTPFSSKTDLIQTVLLDTKKLACVLYVQLPYFDIFLSISPSTSKRRPNTSRNSSVNRVQNDSHGSHYSLAKEFHLRLNLSLVKNSKNTISSRFLSMKFSRTIL